MAVTLIIIGLAVFFFIYGKIRADLVAFCAMLALVITGTVTPTEALASFGDPVVFVIIGLFLVSAGVFRTGLAKMIGSKIIMLAGSSETKLYFLMMFVATFLGIFVTGTGTTALLIPIVVSMSMSNNINVSRFLMPLSFAAGIGSSFTMINASNLVIQRTLVQNNFNNLDFFSFTPLGLIASVVALVFLWFLSKIFLSNRRYGESKKAGKSFEDLVNEYQLHSKTFFAYVLPSSPVINLPLRDLKLTQNYDISILRVSRLAKRRQSNTYEMAGPGTILKAGDRVEIMGDQSNVERFINENNLRAASDAKLDSTGQGIVEALLMPTSVLNGVSVRDSGFREKYNANIIAINRRGEYTTENLQNATLTSGDALLVHGTWDDLARLDQDYINLVVVGKPMEEAAKVTLDHKAPIAGVILIGMMAVVATELMPTVVAVLLAAVLMIMTGCIRNLEEGYNSINWSAVVLIASMMPISVAMHKTGLDVMISQGLIDMLGSKGPFVLLAGLYAAMSTMTLFMNGMPIAIMFAPIGFQIATAAGVSPYPFLVAVAAATNLYFASPFSSTTNIMVTTAGRYTFMDFVKVGLPLQIIVGIAVVLALPVLYPFK